MHLSYLNLLCQSQGAGYSITNLNQLMLDLHVKGRSCKGGSYSQLVFSLLCHLQLKETALQCPDLSENDQEPPPLETNHLDSLLMTDEIILGFIMQG